MAPFKRKRSQEDGDKTRPDVTEAKTRRATRQTATAPLPIQPEPEPRRRRGRTNTIEEALPTDTDELAEDIGAVIHKGDTATSTHRPSVAHSHEKENIAASTEPSRAKPARRTRNRAATDTTTDLPTSTFYGTTASTTTDPTALQDAKQPPPTRRRRPSGTGKPRPANEPKPLKASKPKPTTISPPEPSTSTPSKPSKDGAKINKKTTADRNIDQVLFGDLCFKTWYPSPYPKDVIGDISSPSQPGTVSLPYPETPAVEKKSTTAASINSSSKTTQSQTQNGGKGGTKHGKDGPPPMLDRLCVCPTCFKYSKELIPWLTHVRICRDKGYMPGRKIYVQPKKERRVMVPVEGAESGVKGRKGSSLGSGGVKMVEKIIRDSGEWGIWEVDGDNEKDALFCQNLSLFAKLFLDNKSVFFDVEGFSYFLLVYAKPQPDPSSPPQRHIVGFFSKEKMSWDNNNLACILVFPPWQRKGLGALLMGVSYEIARREGLLGGPEKPISDLGKKGYRRFWAGEIARWFLGLQAKDVVSVEACSRDTWIAVDDCLAVLREMGVVKDAGMGPPRVEKKEVVEGDGGEDGAVEVEVPPPPPVKDVPRVSLDKAAVRAWIVKNKISLEKACDPSGFIEGYAMKPEETVEEEE